MDLNKSSATQNNISGTNGTIPNIVGSVKIESTVLFGRISGSGPCSIYRIPSSSKIHSQRPNTMKETLHWPGILGKPSYIYSGQEEFKIFSDTVIFSQVKLIF